jgi:hypothetical protein
MHAGASSMIELAAAALFAVAVLHTFATRLFSHLAAVAPAHAGLWHLLGEVEVVFGFWAMLLVVLMFGASGERAAVDYLQSLDFTEPMFVFAIMVIAGSRPILLLARDLVVGVARASPLPQDQATFFLILSLIPLLGSFITEPAAMTLAALMLREHFLRGNLPQTFRYATIATLFVNVSIGGVLTPYAAPPVLMVAGPWGWDVAYMLQTFGWRAALAVLLNALAVTFLFRSCIEGRALDRAADARDMPRPVQVVHVLLLAGVVAFSHHPPVFLALFLLFLGFADAYRKYQDRLMLRQGLMVAFFLAGLITLGGYQRWWLQDVLAGMSPTALYWGATALTAITDNAALTYLGALVEGVDEPYKYALVSGAITGGGLTVIANAPNPAGLSILKGSFRDGAVSAAGLFAGAIVPTVIAAGAFLL